jgi:hypothetical protein
MYHYLYEKIIMKISLSLFVLFLLPIVLLAQTLNYNSSLKSALHTAHFLKKDVFVVISSENTNNEKQNLLFNDAEVVNKINKAFVTYETNYADTALRAITKYYNIREYPTYIFLHDNMELFYRSLEFGATKERFIDILNDVEKASQQITISSVRGEYFKDTTNISTLKRLIDLLKKQGVTDNAYFIEQYAKKLNPLLFEDYQTVLYILEGGPIINRIAYNKAFANRAIIDSIFRKESSQKRGHLLTLISDNTMNNAIKTNCLADAQNTAIFHKNQWKNNEYNGQKIYNEKMLFYYNSIKDTINYFRMAADHYNKYYMSVRVNSIKKLSSMEKTDSTLHYKPGWKAKSFPNGLNEVSWNFYISGTKNRNHLQKAIKWSKRSIRLDPDPNNFDTLAHLFYAMQDFKKAIKTQEMALSIAKTNHLPFKVYLENLTRIKLKTL